MKKRLFLAINFPETITDEIYAIRQELERLNPQEGINWVEKENIHLTVFFIGDFDEERIPFLVTALQNTLSKGALPFDVRPEIGGFPDSKHPKVIFMKVKDGERLRSIVTEVEKALYSLGIEERDKLFHPHITLAKVDSDITLQILDDFFLREHECQIESIDLMESTQPPVGFHNYSILKKISLL